MKLIDRFIFFEWLKIFAITICLTLGILIMHDMYNNLADLIDWGVSSSDILLYYMLIIPTLIPVILPISLLLSVIFTLGSMHKNNELTALRCAGLNIFRITYPFWLAGIVLSGLLFLLNSKFIPEAVEKSNLLVQTAELESQKKHRDIAQVGLINQLCFNNRHDSRLWFMNGFSMAMNKGKGIRVSVLDENGLEEKRVMAREGVYDDALNCWFFKDGQEIIYDTAIRRAIKALSFEKKYYKDFKENPTIMILSMKRPKDLSLMQTKTLIEAFGENSPEARVYLVKWYSMWMSSLACIIVVAIAIPFSVAGVRTNPMVGVSKTFGLFFLYYVLDSIVSAMGGRGMMSPIMAAALPNIFMFIFAMWLYRKVI